MKTYCKCVGCYAEGEPTQVRSLYSQFAQAGGADFTAGPPAGWDLLDGRLLCGGCIVTVRNAIGVAISLIRPIRP